jgi:hypothetical protein
VAGAITNVFISTNSGMSWISNTVPVSTYDNPYGRGLIDTVSLGGNSIVVTVTIGLDPEYFSIDVSTNAGQSFFESTNVNSLAARQAASSANGKIQAIAMEGPEVFASTNFGDSWFVLTSLPEFGAEQYQGLAMSADGNTLIVMNGLNVCTTTNFGASWMTNNSPEPGAYYLADSADGINVLAATLVGGQAYVSRDSGANWTQLTNVPAPPWDSVASSADGKKLVMVARPGEPWIYTSDDSGTSWISNNAPALSWTSVASSADGNKLYASAQNGGIWTLQTTQAPQLNIGFSSADLNLSWTVPSTTLVLQESPDLVSWASLTNASAINFTNLQEQVTLSPTNGVGFFRLISH